MKRYSLLVLISIATFSLVVPAKGQSAIAGQENEENNSVRMVRADREWVYEGMDFYTPLELGIERADEALKAYHFMKFDSEPVMCNGKEYNRLVLTHTQRYTNFEFDPNAEDYQFANYSVKHLVVDETRNKTMGYFREEDGKVYRLMLNELIADSDISDADSQQYTEDVIYDWNLSDGDVWRDNPMYSCYGICNMDFSDEELQLGEQSPITIDGISSKVFCLLDYNGSKDYWNTFIEGIGPVKDGWIGAADPYNITGTYRGNYDTPGLQSYLHGVFNGSGNLIYGEELPQSSTRPRLYLVGDMNDWKIMTEWEIKLSDDPQYGENMYVFTCSENQMISSNQKFRIINSDKFYSFGMPEAGAAPLQLNTESELANSREAEPIQLDSDWNGSLLFRHVDGISASFTNDKSAVKNISDDKPTSTETIYYNLQGTRIAQPTSGNLYIRISNGNAEKVIFK